MSQFHTYEVSDFSSRYGLSNHELFPIITELALPEGAWVAGGAVRDFVRNLNIENDIDIFFTNYQLFDDWTMKLRLSRNDFFLIDHNESALSFYLTINRKKYKFQAVCFAFYENPISCIDSFDFTICQFAIQGNSLFTGEFSLFDLARKRLAVHKLSYGASSVRRMLKYASKGFTACQGCIVQLLTLVSNNPEIIQSNIEYVD